MNVVASVNLSSNIDNSIIKGFRNKSNEKKKSQNEDYDSSNGRPKSYKQSRESRKGNQNNTSQRRMSSKDRNLSSEYGLDYTN